MNRLISSEVLSVVLVVMIFLSRSRLIWNFCLDKFRQQNERFLPAEIASLGSNNRSHALLHDRHLGPTREFFQRDRSLHLAGQIRIVELVGVSNALVRLEFEICPAEGMALAGGKIRERHFVSAAHFRVQMMDRAGKS